MFKPRSRAGRSRAEYARREALAQVDHLIDRARSLQRTGRPARAEQHARQAAALMHLLIDHHRASCEAPHAALTGAV